MSRLIFEGNTEERFGELFPNPFIEQIRVFDNLIEVDVGLYFEIPIGDVESDEFINYMASNLNVFGVFCDATEFDRVTTQKFLTGDSNRQLYKNSFFHLDTDDNDDVKNIDTEKIEKFFNSDGKRFAKALIHFNYPESESLTQFLNLSQERYFACFTSFIEPEDNISAEESIPLDMRSSALALRNMSQQESEKEERLKNQTSDLIYEKIFVNIASETVGTAINVFALNTQPKQVYVQSDGHYYQKTPLQSLDKRYRKIDLVDHAQVANAINPIVVPFVDSIEEANIISITLQEFSNSPRLLTQLQKNINKFSNKSRVTTVGKLYESLVDAVADIDNILIGSERLQKRLVPNTIVLDNRQELTPIITGGRIFSTENTIDHQGVYDPSQYLDLKFVTKRVKPTGYDVDAGYGEDFVIENSSFIFFDYEKSLNYNSYISKVFNPYNILEIFGRNALNAYYNNNKVEVFKSKSSTIGDSSFRPKAIMGNNFSFIREDVGGNIFNLPGYSEFNYQSFDEDNHFFKKDRLNAIGEIIDTYYSKIIEKNFDTVDGLSGYRIRCFEVTDLESVSASLRYTKYRVKVTIEDNTMQFYDDLRMRLKEILQLLESYLGRAEDFCSFNNLDGRFNDFFAESEQALYNEFDFLPWLDGPRYYYYVNALIENSFDSVGSIFSIRNLDGRSINIDLLNSMSLSKYAEISPEAGTLSQLSEFVSLFRELVEIIDVGGDIDQSKSIYNVNSLGVASLREIGERTIQRTFILDEQVIDSYELETVRYGFSNPKLIYLSTSPDDETTRYTLESILEYVSSVYNNIINNSSYINYFTSSTTTTSTGTITVNAQSDMLDDDSLTWAKLFREPEAGSSSGSPAVTYSSGRTGTTASGTTLSAISGYGDIAGAFNQEFREFLQIVVPFVEDSLYLTGNSMSVRDLLILANPNSPL